MRRKDYIALILWIASFFLFAIGMCSVLAPIGILVFGVGMCFSMLWDKISAGIVISLAGIAILLSLIPILKGIKE